MNATLFEGRTVGEFYHSVQSTHIILSSIEFWLSSVHTDAAGSDGLFIAVVF
jgi:hypothetical protein